jgi:hypothetical protein
MIKRLVNNEHGYHALKVGKLYEVKEPPLYTYMSEKYWMITEGGRPYTLWKTRFEDAMIEYDPNQQGDTDDDI